MPSASIARARLPAARTWSAVVQTVVAAAMIMLAIAVDRSPTVFSDTDDYFELGQRIVADVLGALVTDVPPKLSPEDAADAAEDAAERAEDLHMGHSQMASRSAAYALLLYLLDAAGTLWLVASVQALLVAGLVRATWSALVPDAPPAHYLLGMALLSVTSTLPFFVGFAMPDIFAGVAVIAIVLLVVRWRSPYLLALLALALAVHNSHLLLAVAMLPLVALALRTLQPGGYRPLALVGGAIVAAWAFNAAYIQIDLAQTGERLRQQPFLTARLLADGPGRIYLRHACARGEKYVLCRFAHEPLDDSEDILWSDLPTNGVFLSSDYKTRLAIEDEQMRFVADTIAYDPGAVAVSAMRDWGRQLAFFEVEEPVRDPVYYLTDEYWKSTFLPAMITRVADCGPAGNRCALRMTPKLSRAWHGGALAIAVLAGGWSLWRRRMLPLDDAQRRLRAAVALLLGGVVLNAAICGILSGPFARYQSRLVWLVVLAAMLLVSAERVRTRQSHYGNRIDTDLA